ncbi:MAG: Abi family protein [Bacilli bacterium]|jgi:abortive infection bacteriophage resistance protein
MTGIKAKKLSLNLSKDEFIKKMIFHTDDEIERCKKYLDLKGVEYHIVLANFIGLNNHGKVEYKKVSCLYQYDKRIRNILYKYISAFEESIRAFICNKYSQTIDSFKKISESICERISRGGSLSRELEDLDLGKLLNLAKKLSAEEKSRLFGKTEKLSENLNAVRELRNAVSHHRLLFIYEDFETCFIDGKELDSLQANILNLYKLINPYYQEFFKIAINDAIKADDDREFTNAIPKTAIIRI